MDKVEKEFKKGLLEYINLYQFDVFKSGNSKIYSGILAVLKNINNNHIDNDNFTLIVREEVKKVSLKLGKPKTFIFGGNFIVKGKKVVLLELSETIGTYYLEDVRLVHQLSYYKIGMKIRLEKIETESGVKGVTMTLPMEQSSETDLFSSCKDIDEDIDCGKHL